MNDLWYALPLLVAVSLVYSATRHERWKPILSNAVRFGAWVAGLMLAVMIAIMVMGWLG